MSTSKNRKLAAILFADIVGYTALMQKDEITANQNLEKFHQTLNEIVGQYKGQIINNYGDGCVCSFDSAVDAMQCAKEIQITFQTDPKVPVRIGLHSGDVFFKEDNVYGDSVNIASRIESLGVAGAVLFSKRIKRDIANQTEFKVQSLGEFDFKNVEKTMEVFGLANDGLVIPNQTEMKGKGQLVSSAPNGIAKWLKLGGLALALLTVFGLAWNVWMVGDTLKVSPTIQTKSIAVLPFKDLSKQQDQEYFSDGVAEEILNALSKLEDLKVAGRISSFSFKGKPNASLNEIGEQLNVNTILNGSIRKSDNQIRVTANLVNVADGFQIWSEVYDEELKDIFSVQERIARNIVQKFQLSQSPKNKPLFVQQTANSKAYESYLKGRFFASKGIDGLKEAERAFKQAIALDTSYASAYSDLAGVHWGYAIYGLSSADAAFEKMKNLATKATILDDQSAAAYHWLGYYYCFYKQDWLLGLDYLNKAVGIDESYEAAYHMVIMPLRPTPENFEKAIVSEEKNVAKDPLSIGGLMNLNRVNLWAEKYKKVIEGAQKVFELNPNQRSTMRHISEAYLFSGQPEKALPYTEKMTQKDNYAFYDYLLNLVMLERAEEAKTQFLERKDSLVAFDKAYSYFVLNEPAEGFKWLEQARLDRDPKVIFYKVDAHLNAYREDDRYKAFEARMNFPKALKD